MYKCLDCGFVFEESEAKKVTEEIGECFGSPAFEESYVCPRCEGYFEETKTCVLCGEPFLDKEWVDGEYCGDCAKQYKEDFRNLMSRTYDENERKLINIIFEGEEL